MTRNEITLNSIIKEIEKLNKSKARIEKQLAKRVADCEKKNCNWTDEEWFKMRDLASTTNEQKWTWFEKYSKERDLADINHRLENAQGRLEKAEARVEADKESAEENASIKVLEENFLWFSRLDPTKQKEILESENTKEYLKWVAEVKAMCKVDGINMEIVKGHEFCGTTPKGERFALFINNGYSLRSLHCYSLTIAGSTVFTSGTFATAYRYIKNR